MWTFKLIGALAVIAAATGLGVQKGQALTDRRAALEDLSFLLSLLGVNLENGQEPLWSLLPRIAQENHFSILHFPAALAEGEDVREIMRAYLTAAGADRYLSGQQSKIALNALLCATTKEETKARLGYYSRMLQKELEDSRTAEEKNKKLFWQLGMMAGIVLAVILL